VLLVKSSHAIFAAPVTALFVIYRRLGLALNFHRPVRYRVSSAAGIARVIFLEPYPKSLTSDLHGDSATIEGADRGKYQQFPSVKFDHFCGVSPRRYSEIFERYKRKDENGDFIEWNDNNIARPIIDLKFPFYEQLEEQILTILSKYLETLDLTVDDLFQ
jgi:hypothetical protein